MNFTSEERAAMKERAQEVRKSRGAKAKDQEPAVLEKIAEMDGEDRAIAERLHAIVKEVAPEMLPRLWYGMPAYGKGGKATLFFQAKAKFKARYATLGFNDDAQLDDDAMWATAYAVAQLTPEVERRIADLVNRAAG